ncbi:MAG: LamG domain-containing protein, partial [Phycisphaerales bacterium]|nr:LamG domain-containing protein [Phycisphaerales bacterium]
YFSFQNDRPDILYAGFYNGGLRTARPVALGTWMHLAWVRDSNAGANGPFVGSTLYVDGCPVAMEPDSDLPGFTTVDVFSSPFRIQRAADFNRFADVTMDELALYDTLLSETEIRARVQALGIPTSGGCAADLTGDCGHLDIFDVILFLQYFDAEDARADLAPPLGSFDIFDILAYLERFADGC